MDNKENNSPLSGERVPQVKSVECDTPKCRCGGRTALVSGSWYFTPDQEPYLNGMVQESKVSDGDEHIIGYVCDDCGSLTDLFSDDREGYSSRIAELEAENAKLREALGSLKQFLYNEITERRNYSASKSFEIVLEQIEIAEQSINGNEK